MAEVIVKASACNQFGFMQFKSISNAIFQLLNYIYENLNRVNSVSGIYFDLSQGFDELITTYCVINFIAMVYGEFALIGLNHIYLTGLK